MASPPPSDARAATGAGTPRRTSPDSSASLARSSRVTESSAIALDPADLGALLGGSPERASEDAPSQDSILEALAADDLAGMD